MKRSDLTPVDRKLVERFVKFLRILGPANNKKRRVSPETLAYMKGEDVEPMPYVSPSIGRGVEVQKEHE